jgi:hypothetical protein
VTQEVPLLAEYDESADIRVILEPTVKTVDPDMMMGILFRNSDLETRFGLNSERVDRRATQGLLVEGSATRLLGSSS